MQTFQEQLLETSGVIADTLGTVFPSFDEGAKAFKTALKISLMQKFALTASMKAEVFLAQAKYMSSMLTQIQLEALRRCVESAEAVVRTVSQTDLTDAFAPKGRSKEHTIARCIYDLLVKDTVEMSAVQQLKKDGNLFSAVLGTVREEFHSALYDMVKRELEIRRLDREGKYDLRQLKEDTSAIAFAKAFQQNQEYMQLVYTLLADLCDEAVTRIVKGGEQEIMEVSRFMYNNAMPKKNFFMHEIHGALMFSPTYSSFWSAYVSDTKKLEEARRIKRELKIIESEELDRKHYSCVTWVVFLILLALGVLLLSIRLS